MELVEIAVEHACFLGEGPVWDSKSKKLCWVDIVNGNIHEFDPKSGTNKTIFVQQMIGAVAFCTNGNFLAALKNGLAFVSRTTGELTLFSDLEAGVLENRFNDGKCDPSGRFWIGSMAIDEQPGAGNLYMLDTEHHITTKVESTTISNGMAWSPDQRTFYHIDTPTKSVVAYDFDITDGAISNKRTIISINEEEGFPDGMNIDNEGMLWIAHWSGWQLSRWNPLTGKKLFSLPIPVANVTSCTFGGEDLSDLYITTAQKGLSPQELEQQPHAGKLFVWKNSGYKGMAAFEFKG